MNPKAHYGLGNIAINDPDETRRAPLSSAFRFLPPSPLDSLFSRPAALAAC